MKRLILLSLAGMGLAVAARGDIIYVQGDVSGTWSADTVMVTGEISVPADASLSIVPGVEVIFAGHYKFNVLSNAMLSAAGTEQDTILFTAARLDSGWHGIRFFSASSASMLQFCHISFGKTGISYQADQDGGGIYCQNSSPSILNCLIEHCSATLALGGGISCADGGNATIAMNTFLANEAGAGGAIATVNSSPIIQGNSFSLNSAAGHGGGIYCDVSIVNISGNTLWANSSGGGGSFGLGAGIGCMSCSGIIEDNFVTGNFIIGYSGSGGGIGLTGSDVIVRNNRIEYNEAMQEGGGIYCDNSAATIHSNIIRENTVHAFDLAEGGGGIGCSSAYPESPFIYANIIHQNVSEARGGGIGCDDSDPMIEYNLIYANTAGFGAGFYTIYSTAQLRHNLILYNSADFPGSQMGGGIGIQSDAPVIQSNLIASNYAGNRGGGVYWNYGSMPVLSNCTFSHNTADSGGAIESTSVNTLAVISAIAWDDSLHEFYAGSPATISACYSDVEDGWPGLGNISLDPAFVDTAHDDYRLLWGSPCIDAGHPDSLDPDGTRADMGTFYYDQSKPVRILLTPHEIPYLIPDSGGTMTYTLRLDTHLEEPQVATFWCDVTLPDSSILGPLLGPATVDVYPNQMVSWVRYQGVPGTAPLGVSHYNAYAVVGGDTSKDSFMFGVMGFGSDIQDPWENWGDPLGVPPAPLVRPGIPAKFALHPPHPNPFNATTAASFELRAASEVGLQVFDTGGKLVQTLVKAWMPAGFHEAVFDGADLPSGIYICRLQAGKFEGVQKMVLLK